MFKITLLTFTIFLSVCNVDSITVNEVLDEMVLLLESINDINDFSDRTINAGYIAKGALEYLWQVKSYSKAQELSAELQLFLTKAEEANPDLPIVQWFKDESFLWVADFSANKKIPGTTVSRKSAQQIADAVNEAAVTDIACIPDAYSRNVKTTFSRSCDLDAECVSDRTSAAWIEGQTIVSKRNRYSIFLKYQLRCNNFDQYYDIQVMSQLEVIFADIKVLIATEPFNSDFRFPLIYQLYHAAINGFEQFLTDDIISIILTKPDICGISTDPSLDRIRLQLGCLAIWAMKLKALLS